LDEQTVTPAWQVADEMGKLFGRRSLVIGDWRLAIGDWAIGDW